MTDIQELIDKEPQRCAWCPEPARGDAWHNDYKLHPSCGQIGHGEGWVPELKGKTETARTLPTREEIAMAIAARHWDRESGDVEVWHDLTRGEREAVAENYLTWDSADAVLSLLNGQNND